MANIANQGDISYLMDELERVVDFLWIPLKEKLQDDSHALGKAGRDMARDLALLNDWISNQKKMTDQAAEIDKMGFSNNVTFLDKANPKSIDTLFAGIKESLDKEAADKKTKEAKDDSHR